MPKKKLFRVFTYTIDKNENSFQHWAKGLNMLIIKDEVTITLNEEEIKKLVTSLPRTFGGEY